MMKKNLKKRKEKKFNNKIAEAKSQRKINNLQFRKQQKIDDINFNIENGWVVLLNLSVHVASQLHWGNVTLHLLEKFYWKVGDTLVLESFVIYWWRRFGVVK